MRSTNAVPSPRILPTRIEVSHDRLFRLRNRVVFTLKNGGWEKTRLYP